jgi:hypothetical protein
MPPVNIPTRIDFSAYIAEHTKDFIGRDWVFAEIDLWLAHPSGSTFFIITGEPGSGKSAIAARLTQVYDLAAYHFCIARQADTTTPSVFARALSQQLCRFDGFAAGILKDSDINLQTVQNIQANYGQAIGAKIETLVVNAPSASLAFTHAVTEPLKALYAGGFDRQVLILVDALDEAAQHPGPETIVDLLASASGLSDKVRFILTSRPEGAVLRHLEQRQIPYFQLGADRPENLADIRRYVCGEVAASERLKERLVAQGMLLETFVERVTTASCGNFLYLIWLLPAIADGTQRFDALEALPRGLDGIYREFLRTRKVGSDEERWRNQYRPAIGVLAAARAALTLDQVVSFASLNKQAARDLLRDIAQFLNHGLAEQGQYRLYHQSVADFLDDDERAGEFWIDLGTVHQQIANRCLNRYGPGWFRYDNYAIEHTLSHIREAIKRATDESQDEGRQQLEKQETALLSNGMFISGTRLAEETRGTVDRDPALRAIDAWLADRSGAKVFLLVGAPGSGKTVLTKQLQHMSRGGRTPQKYPKIGQGLWVVSHFCRASQPATLDPSGFATSVSLQLAERYPKFAETLNRNDDRIRIHVSQQLSPRGGGEVIGVTIDTLYIDAGQQSVPRFDLEVRKPLIELLTPDFRDTILIVVDALDEALIYEGKQTIVELLWMLEALPAQVRLLVISRPNLPILRNFLDVKIFDLEDNILPGVGEVRQYIYERLGRLFDPQRWTLSEEIARRAGGNFLYARLLVDEITTKLASGMLEQVGLPEEPKGLKDFFRNLLLWDLGRDLEKWESHYRPLLGVLAVAQGNGLTCQQLSGILGLRLSKIQESVGKCAAVLDGAQPDGPFHLYHTSFQSFLLNDQEEYFRVSRGGPRSDRPVL